MMKIEIRMAQTGHSEKICADPASKGDIVYTHINNVYKISPKDQLVITKIGHVIKQDQQLKKQLSQMRGDQTLASKYISENQTKSNELISCIYFFNLKEFALINEKIEPKPSQYWKNELEEKLNIVKSLKPIISQYVPLQKCIAADKIKQFDKIAKKINNLAKQFIMFQDKCLNLKDIQFKIEQVTQRCSNQKNSCISLFKSLEQFFDQQVMKPINDFVLLQKQLETSLTTNSNNLRQNSSFFQNKKNLQNSNKFYFDKIHEMKQNFESDKTQIKKQVKRGRSKFRPVDERVTQYGKSIIIKKMEQSINTNKNNYNSIIAFFKQITEGADSKLYAKLESDIDHLEKNVRDQKQDMIKSQKMLKLKYLQFSELNQQNRNIIKQVYSNFIQMKNKFNSYKEEITQLHHNITEELRKNQQKNNRLPFISSYNLENDIKNESIGNYICERQIFELSISSQIELKRRIGFNRRVNFIHSFIDKICAEEQFLRKKYIQNCKKQGKLQKIFLNNWKVPFIDVDYNGTTDLQVIKSTKSNKSSSSSELNESSITIEQFLILEYSQMVDLINSIRKQNQSIKVNNMMDIIKRMSDIFAKVYNKKYNQLQQNSTKLVQTIGNLEESITKLDKNIQQKNIYKNQLEKCIQQKSQKIVALNNQLNQQKSKSEGLNLDFSSLKRDLKKQAQINNTLCEQIARYQEQCENNKRQFADLKVLLGVKQVEIYRLQEQLDNQDKLKQSNLLDDQVQNQNEIDLKSMVMKQFNTEANNKQIKRLSQQISYLQSQNEQLQQQFDTLSAEMRKIIMKQTQDIQIQTEPLQISSQSKAKQVFFHNQTNNSQNNRITIEQEIVVGQNALFIPFDNHQYVGIHHKDEDRTLCNMNNSQLNNYILDFSSFNGTTKQLLSQCSFLVILKVTGITKQDKKRLVQGKIKYMFGFEDDSTLIKNYSKFLPPQ